MVTAMAQHDSVIRLRPQEESGLSELEELVERAKGSELFSAPTLQEDSARFLAEHADRLRAIAAAEHGRARHVWFVGSGGSWASMYSGKYLCDRLTGMASDVALSYELTWRAPKRLGADSLVVVASYSGGTEDTLAALRFAKSRGARTLALVSNADSPIGSEADQTIAYSAPGLYCLPLLAVTLLAGEWGRLEGDAQAADMLERVPELPARMGDAYRGGRARGLDLAEQFGDSHLLYAIGAGPLYGLAYKFGLTVFMENMRIHGSVIESAEFRHGPAEMLDRRGADLAVLLGTDESREITERTLDFATKNGARCAVL
jgi:fructoselysine 6-phosphate deglycase